MQLSILIPSRCERFLKNTVEDIIANSEADTEIIIGLDGKWSEPPIAQHPNVNIIHVPESVGQRGITNLCAKLSHAKFLMKCDAHCSFDKGFDRKMLDAFKVVGDNVTMVPVMRNLWAFDWKCLTKGTMIVTPRGLKPIEEIREGEEIVSGDGKPHKVNAVMSKNADRDIVRVKPYLLPAIEITEDHPVKVYPYEYRKITQPNSHETVIGSKEQWIEAGKLKDGMYKMIFPFSNEENLGTLSDIKNKEQIAKMLGYFMAEGNFYHKNLKGEYMKMTLCLNWDEDCIADEIEKIIGDNFNNRYGKKATVRRFKKIDKRTGYKYMRVNIYSQEATRFIRKFILGENSRNKMFVPDVLGWPKEIQKILLETMIKGDGWVGKCRGNTVTTYTTSSKQLSYQVFTIMLRLGYQPGITEKVNNGTFGVGNLSYDIRAYSNSNGKNCKGVVRGNEYIVSINTVNKVPYIGDVYDLTIDGLPEILTEGGVVHNCYHCGWKKYQGPTPEKCEQCGKTDKIRRKIIWKAKHNPQSWSYCFDSEPHFQYFGGYKDRPETIKQKETGFTETMSLQGSCWMSTKENYWRWDLGGEELGSWGNQGLQVACATWLSEGRVLVNHSTWYAHMFRTQGGDFSFPYPQSGKHVSRTKNRVKDLFWNHKHPTQIKPVSWLVDKFWPVKGWTEADLEKLKEHEKVALTLPTTSGENNYHE